MWHEFLINPKQATYHLQLTCHRKADGSSLYWADLLTRKVTGSRLWQLTGSPLSEETESRARTYIKEAMPDAGTIDTATWRNTMTINIKPERTYKP